MFHRFIIALILVLSVGPLWAQRDVSEKEEDARLQKMMEEAEAKIRGEIEAKYKAEKEKIIQVNQAEYVQGEEERIRQDLSQLTLIQLSQKVQKEMKSLKARPVENAYSFWVMDLLGPIPFPPWD